MRPPTISITSKELENSTLITMHAHGMITSAELRKSMDLAIMNMLGMPEKPWWEEHVP